MQLVPWRTLGEVSARANELEDLWNRYFDLARPFRTMSAPWTPTTDVKETEETIVVTAELPGAEPEQIHVDFSDGVLTIKGEKKGETEEKGAHHYYKERYSGNFLRSFQLPCRVLADGAQANFEKGVLTVTLPKALEDQKTKIDVQYKK
ncbi:Hsp20/alpha crystallin family protein [Desulfatibacillum aliphaticivorans]|uniref:Heat shock protein Hsp20 n=1 Tax=Desulfatibacillum aliphaticivorans TaxID=218208 RepID=B8FM33_DESAL|nr:Hsp20/alpha crystallin family protein [Desulfatibacillum aliphaticivorans]ACL05766.1 heat shock protein Hsp20 [Desulfatibacillum aliphaticivorans]